jgi:hypothetical protein
MGEEAVPQQGWHWPAVAKSCIHAGRLSFIMSICGAVLAN